MIPDEAAMSDLIDASLGIRAREVVDNGMDLLDSLAETERWVFDFDLDTFSLDNPRLCVAGQFAKFTYGRTSRLWPDVATFLIGKAADYTETDEYHFGFDSLGGDDTKAIEDAWRLAIEQRRADLS